jgi:hypothetical protein
MFTSVALFASPRIRALVTCTKFFNKLGTMMACYICARFACRPTPQSRAWLIQRVARNLALALTYAEPSTMSAVTVNQLALVAQTSGPRIRAVSASAGNFVKGTEFAV